MTFKELDGKAEPYHTVRPQSRSAQHAVHCSLPRP
jgi:hypothetical protein